MPKTKMELKCPYCEHPIDESLLSEVEKSGRIAELKDLDHPAFSENIPGFVVKDRLKELTNE